MSDNRFFLALWGIAAVVLLVLVAVGVVVNEPDWKVDREMSLECARRGGVRVALGAQASWRAGCYSVHSLDSAVPEPHND